MKRLISLHLAFILLLSSLMPVGGSGVALASSKKQSTCEDGECIPGLVARLEDLTKLYKNQCLPKDVKSSEYAKYHKENGLTEECWKFITEIGHLEKQLEAHKTRLEARLGCESGDCKLPDSGNSLNAQLNQLTKVEQKLSCTEPKKQEIRKNCAGDMGCVLISSALGMGGYLVEKLVPEKVKPKNCHLGDDSCLTQLATGFLKAAFTFFEGAWELLKMGGKAVAKKTKEFWNWVSGAEDHSSTSQLAMAKASEEEGFFQMLRNDFSGTMKKVWEGLVASLKEWLKNDIFCEKWSGVPHFGKCLAPAEGFDCLSCKTMLTGLCGITGTLVAEVIPAFFTGGLITAAKHGVNGAVKISKLFKVTPKAMSAIKNSRAGKMAVQTSTKVDDALHLSKGLQAAKVAIEGSLKLINRYLLSPARKGAKASFTALSEMAKKGGLYVMETSAGKVLSFTGTSIKYTGKALIYPIENPLTVFAFKSGMRTFDKAFTLGAPKLTKGTVVAAAIVDKSSDLERQVAKLEVAKATKTSTPEEILKLEQATLKEVEPVRKEVLEQALKNDKPVEFDEVVKHLYPELKYDDLSKSIPKEKVLAAEQELFIQISQSPAGPKKDALIKRYHQHVVHGEARSQVVGRSPSYAQVIENSKLADKERFQEAMKLLKKENLSPEEASKLAQALEEAHLIGEGNGVFEYTWSELREKYNILVKGGYTKDEADLLIRTGLAGRPPVRELIEPGKTLFHGFAEDIIDNDYLKKRKRLDALIKKEYPGSFLRTADAQKIKDNLESIYFIDYNHTLNAMDNIRIGDKPLEKVKLSGIYDDNAFQNFKKSRSYLLDEKPPLNKETMLEVHRRMMDGGIENVRPDQLGKIRYGHWYGNVPRSHAIDAKIRDELMSNPYLTWVEEGQTFDGKFYGQIHYPNVDHVRKEGLDLIRKNHKDLAIRIEKYQTERKTLSDEILKKERDYGRANSSEDRKRIQDQIEELKKQRTALEKNKLQTTQELVDAMVDDLMDWFNRERTRIGDIDSPAKLDKYVDLVAKFQRDLVAIHPLSNGNGRTTREFALSYALMKEGFPPPRILNPNSDLYSSLDDWKLMIKHGILASDFLVDDLIERLKFGLPVENSVDLITPYTRPPVKNITLKGSRSPNMMEGVEYIDSRLYREMTQHILAKNPELSTKLKTDPLKAWDEINAEVEGIFRRNNAYYKHPKNGIERVELSFVDDDFKLLFGKASYKDAELYNFKMKTWYQDAVVWRGLASKSQTYSEAELIQMFKELSSHNASNAVLGKVRSRSPEAIRAAALEDFEKFNSDVFGEGLVRMAKDHSETGPLYRTSYGYSSSKNREVGKAFAMGAMVVGEYGAHKAPELQALLKSRVLVGSRRANKDVDLGRLKQLREEFSYKYGRQQEVMGIGATDPDAVTIIQTIDADGSVIRSYLRNKEKPNEIWVITGNIAPDEIPKKSQIEKIIDLNRY
jgi:hypothetical protein